MAGRERKTTRITISLDECDYRNLASLARRSDASIAWAIRWAIGDFLRHSPPVRQLSSDLSRQRNGRDR